MDEIWRRREVALVEGPFDLGVFERLVPVPVLALTTNAVNPMQMKFLRRFVQRVYMCTDRDKAGRDGRDSFRDQVGSDFDIVSVAYPCVRKGDKDIGDFWKAVGDDRFAKHFQRELRL